MAKEIALEQIIMGLAGPKTSGFIDLAVQQALKAGFTVTFQSEMGPPKPKAIQKLREGGRL